MRSGGRLAHPPAIRERKPTRYTGLTEDTTHTQGPFFGESARETVWRGDSGEVSCFSNGTHVAKHRSHVSIH